MSHTHVEEHPHIHGPQPQSPGIPAQAPDPALQAIIEADFRPVPLILGPENASALCEAHSLEKCTDCNVDFVNTNRLAKLLVMNPSLMCPPPPNIVSQKLSQAVNNMKEEGNVRSLQHKVLHSTCDLYSPFHRPSSRRVPMLSPSPATQWQLTSSSNVHHGKPSSSCARNFPPSYPIVPPHISNPVTTSAHLSTQTPSSPSAVIGAKAILESRKPSWVSENIPKPRMQSG